MIKALSSKLCITRVHTSILLKHQLRERVHNLHVRSCFCLRQLACHQKVSVTKTDLLYRTLSISSVCSQKLSSSHKKASSDHALKGTAPDVPDAKNEEHVGIFKRFKNAYKEHGKVLVGVHLATSTVWISIFYYAAASGVDLVPLLQKLGAADKIIQIANSSIGNLATAYLMYKLATPARYTVTLFGTFSMVKYLRQLGYMKAPDEKDSIRKLMKDGHIQMKEKYGDVKEKLGDWKDEKLKNR